MREDAARGAPHRTGQAFVGREAELAVLARRRERAAAGSPCLVAVEGEAGIGKTSLIKRALDGVPDLGTCWARCDQSEQDWPYSAVDQWIRRLPSGTGTGRVPADLTSKNVSPLTVGAELLDMVTSAAKDRPLALVVDDVQWADRQSLAVLGFVLRRLWSDPVMVVITVRGGSAAARGIGEEPGDGWRELLRSAAEVEAIRLTGLDASAIGELAKARTGTVLPSAGAKRLMERTGGHPLHVQTLIGQVTPQQLEDMSLPLPVPASLENSINLQLAGLPTSSRRLVEALAVLDMQVSLPVVGRLAALEDPAAALEPALAAGLVTWQSDEPLGPVRLQHRLQRDAVYNALAPDVRRDLHAAAAGVVPANSAWAHRVAAADGADTSLALELTEEADRQGRAGRAGRAATLLLWAADLSPAREQYEDHLLTAATYLLKGYAWDRARSLRGAIESCSPTPRRDAIIGSICAVAGELASAEDYLMRAREALPSSLEPVELAEQFLGTAYVINAQNEKAVPLFASRLGRLNADGRGHGRTEAWEVFSIRALHAWSLGFTEGPWTALGSMNHPRLPEQPFEVDPEATIALRFRGALRIRAGYLEAGSQDIAALVERSADGGVPTHAMDYYMLSISAYLRGAWDEALTASEQALLVGHSTGQRWGLPPAFAVASMIHAHRGHWEKARPLLNDCRVASSEEFGYSRLNGIFPLLAEAVAAQARADYPAMAAALVPLDDAGSVAPDLRITWQLLWQPLLVEALTAAGCPTDNDLALAEAAVEAFESHVEVPGLRPSAWWMRGRLAEASGDVKAASEHYRNGVEAPHSDEIALNRAFLNRDLARLIKRTGVRGLPSEADACLDRARRIYRRLGATPYIDHLVAAEGPSTATATTVEVTALTDRELTVARLAAQRMTNQEIARELFLSPKTVEYHLSHVYTKLHLSGRRELPAALNQ